MILKSGRTSGLKRGNRKGCDQRTSSESWETMTARSDLFAVRRARRLGAEDALRGVNGESAASLRACRDVVRFDVNDDFDFVGVARSCVG